MKPQLRANKDLPQAILDYLTKTDINQISEDVFNILALIFKPESFGQLITEEFIQSIFNGLDIIKEEDNYSSIIKILVRISQDKKYSDMFLNVFNNHPKQGPLIESMLRILNKSDEKGDMMHILQCFADIMETKKECLFYRTDIETFIDIALQKLRSTYTEELRFLVLRVLFGVLQYVAPSELYKRDDMIEVLEDYANSHKVHENNKQFAKQILDKLN
jgi:hypothetical protein